METQIQTKPNLTSSVEVWPLRNTFSRRTCIWIGSIAFTLMLVAILLANWTTSRYGFVPVGFGLEATVGTYFAGASLVLRDLIQDAVGRKWVIVAIIAGSILSFALAAPEIALASVAAYFIAEMLDFAVYTPLREKAKFGGKKWTIAVVLSNIVGAIADTVVFLGIAFGFGAIEDSILGQLVGKTWATVAYLVLGYIAGYFIRKAVARKEKEK